MHSVMSQIRGTASPSSSNHTLPTQNPYSSPEEHWQAILRYDAQRRQATETQEHHIISDQNTVSTMHKPTRVKRVSVGDDLPHFPEEYQRVQETQKQSNKKGKAASQSIPKKGVAKYSDAIADLNDDTNGDEHELTLGRQVTPPAFRGENDILVNRELQRLREQKPMKRRMHWRVVTGTMMLLVLAFTAYVFTQSLRAYLSLSPANWFLSDSRTGTQVSPDPLLRTLALIETIASAIALAGMLASGFYLRMTRRRTCGRHLIWFFAILSTTISLALSLANIVLIVAWHKEYSGNPDDPLARTRDVGQRCNGVWDLDILWSAAKSSLLAKPNDESVDTSKCTRDPAHSVQMFLIAGGVRLIVFVVLCTIWLICLARYNAAQELRLTSNESINESPEMHLLLAEEKGGLPEMPTLQSMPGKYHDEDMDMVAFYQDENKSSPRYSGSTWNEKGDGLVHMPEFPRNSNATLIEPAPKLGKFQWQRGEASQMQKDDQNDIHTYGNIATHDREESAGGWSTHIMDRLWHALWGSSHEQNGSSHEHANRDPSHAFQAVSIHEEAELQHPHAWQHGREDTRLGVRGWFGRDTSAQSRPSEDEGDEDDLGVRTNVSYLETPPMHTRTSSQDRRAAQGRHEAAKKVHDKQADSDNGDRFTAGPNAQNTARQAAYQRSLRRKQEQKDRIEFLASLGREEDLEKEPFHPPALPTKEGRMSASTNSSYRAGPSPNREQKSRSTQSNGDQLPHMPNLQSTPRANAHGIAAEERSEEDDMIDESIFWHSAPVVEKKQSNAPVFVRQLGKLVRQLSAIESVGSGGERSQQYSRTSREPSSASGIY
ncbi:uncharacterized protein FA14DRAFT_53820 [Meira miltonrushii]|uniref:Uncharacterized protein n=1 Tax=Meira miltonrushii TaxID=1280837 RepID=A0A316VF80_9BASI|nr:uncharacterized protein FA14DRAFT_53820 [Meira miltonrushii]PWN36289.1 hypothetical protein FA14DRAFT_53820 [Meira miltonrushii]